MPLGSREESHYYEISVRIGIFESITNYVTKVIEIVFNLSGMHFNMKDEWIGCLRLSEFIYRLENGYTQFNVD